MPSTCSQRVSRSPYHLLRQIWPALLLVVAAAALPGRGVEADEKLVPAKFGVRADKLGYAYTIDSMGRVRVPFGWLYSATSASRGGLSIQQREMTPNGEEFVLTGMLGHLKLQRRIRVSSGMVGIRIVDSLLNPTAGDITTTLIIQGQANWPYQQVLTDQGRSPSGALAKKEGGIVCHMTQPMQVLVCFQLAAPRTKLRPKVTVSNNHQLQFHYQVTVPAHGRVSLVHGATIRPQGKMPRAKNLSKLFKDVRRAAWLRDLPGEVRKTLLNARTGHDFHDAESLATLEATLQVEPATVDQLAFGEDTLLLGSATCTRLTIDGAYGKTIVPFSLVAAIVGRRGKGRKPGVYLRDGQHLTGHIETEALRFQMTSGMAIDLDVNKLDRLVMRTPKAAAVGDGAGTSRVETTDPFFLFETLSGDRLRAKQGADALHVATRWGDLKLAFSEVKAVHQADAETPGHWVWLVNGSRFGAYLRGTSLNVISDRFGAIQIPTSELRRILLIRPTQDPHGDEEQRNLPHLRLAGGAVVSGRIELDALHFLSPAGLVPQPPALIRLLQREEREGQPAPGSGQRFRADLWGGGHLTGELREVLVPVETASGVLSIPVRDIWEVHVPTPVVPLAVRKQLPNLIADLAHDLWERREAASAALASLGELARAALNEALRETKDPEVERRLRRLLDRL